MATIAEITDWLKANPMASDAEITAAASVAGVSAGQLAQATGLSEANVIERMVAATPAATAIVNQAKATENPLAYVNKQVSLPDTIKDYQGKSYDVNTLKTLASQLSGVVDTSRLSGGAFNTSKANIGFAYDELASGLGANPTTFDQVLMDAARGLYNRGVTDLSKLKQGDIIGEANVYQKTNPDTGEWTGQYYTYIPGTGTEETPAQTRYLTPAETARVTRVSDGDSDRLVATDMPVGQGLYFGDKLVSRNTSLGAGETFTGDGKTNYALEFSNGKPTFITGGESTNFLDTTAGKVALMAGAYFGAPYLSEAIGAATGLTGANLAAATGATIGGTTSALTGQDPLKGALVGGAGGYAGASLGGATSPTGTGVDLGTATGADMDAFYDMGPAQTGGVNLGTATGNDLDLFYDAGVGPGQIDLGGGITINADGSISGGTFNGANGSLMGMDSATAIATGLKNPSSFLPGNVTISDVIKTLPLVNTVATLVGGGGNTGGGGPTGLTGFDIVSIPESWKPPTYTQSTGGTGGTGGAGGFTPIDLNSIFTNQNLLTGTQWQGLPNQRNVTFNDIFAAGQQQTPTGTPVNLNNIVSAILGQTATSQKSA